MKILSIWMGGWMDDNNGDRGNDFVCGCVTICKWLNVATM